MKLYYSPGACSLSPHIALIEATLPFEAVAVDLRTKITQDGTDFNSINPKGQVPALQLDSGEVLTEGVAIVLYIADQNTEANLTPPAGTIERYRLIEWLTFISSEVHKGMSPLWNPALPEDVKPMLREKLDKAFAYLSNHFANNKYLMGETFSVADAYLFTVCNWTPKLQIDINRYGNLIDFMTRVAQRPTVQQAMMQEGLISQAA